MQIEKFDKSYYEWLWGSIHHDDYAENRADALIAMYGKGKYLDVGCGCGILVKTLRDKGCEAWGLEISDYAISESHCPEFVKKGDVRNIPFPDGYFDVIHSWGVLGYFPEEDTELAISECERVGLHQYHMIDINVLPPAYGYESMKPLDWWNKRLPNNMRQ